MQTLSLLLILLHQLPALVLAGAWDLAREFSAIMHHNRCTTRPITVTLVPRNCIPTAASGACLDPQHENATMVLSALFCFVCLCICLPLLARSLCCCVAHLYQRRAKDTKSRFKRSRPCRYGASCKFPNCEFDHSEALKQAAAQDSSEPAPTVALSSSSPSSRIPIHMRRGVAGLNSLVIPIAPANGLFFFVFLCFSFSFCFSLFFFSLTDR